MGYKRRPNVEFPHIRGDIFVFLITRDFDGCVYEQQDMQPEHIDTIYYLINKQKKYSFCDSFDDYFEKIGLGQGGGIPIEQLMDPIHPILQPTPLREWCYDKQQTCFKMQ